MIDFIKKLFRISGEKKKSQGFPPGWSLTVSDLFEELKAGKRKQIAEPEITWAKEYERSLIPANYHYPKKGDLYEAKFDQEVSFITNWSAPYSGGGTTKLFKGEQIWVDADLMEEYPIAADLMPVKYKELENRIVSESERTAFKYESFHFHISTKQLNENFRLIYSE